MAARKAGSPIGNRAQDKILPYKSSVVGFGGVDVRDHDLSAVGGHRCLDPLRQQEGLWIAREKRLLEIFFDVKASDPHVAEIDDLRLGRKVGHIQREMLERSVIAKTELRGRACSLGVEKPRQ